ncbi:MAG: CRISPR-associated endonuclease Cas2 [Cytophagales bacterium]|nr:CRISPR-associated endonuclease Cas2 [Cytophagales bacterium]MDW8384297.1 CRISPR-associated endonuclease Cas2 [Flammeovirgaceae bacterium]
MVFNEYRIMWVTVFFDLPTKTKKDRKQYEIFRKKLLRDGFRMIQFSVYARHCSSKANAEVHVSRVKSWLPPKGHVIIFTITDKQFGMMEIFHAGMRVDTPPPPEQLMLF